MPITHVVTFRLPPSTPRESSVDPDDADIPKSASAIICSDFKALKDTCFDKNGKPYIISIKGGRNNSPEKLDRGFTHTFIVEFASKADRDYYTKEDKVHKEFGGQLWSAAGGEVLVIDFEDGEYEDTRSGE